MKQRWGRSGWAITCALLATILCGCQSTPKTSVGRDGLTYTNTIHNLRVWAANDFNPGQLQTKTLSVSPAASEVPEQKKQDEIEQFERLKRALTDQFFYALDTKRVFEKVVSPNASGSGENADAKLETSIVEYYPGNAALRFTVGFSAGYPSITVHGILRDKAGEPILRFETQREFEARPFEYGDEQILENNVKDLALDFADYLDRLVKGKPLRGD